MKSWIRSLALVLVAVIQVGCASGRDGIVTPSPTPVPVTKARVEASPEAMLPTAQAIPTVPQPTTTAIPQVAQVSCGEELRSSITLKGDLSCRGHALKIVGDNIVLDLGGHSIRGPGKGTWTWPGKALESVGIWAAGRKGVTVRNGRVEGFNSAVLVEGSSAVALEKLTVTGSHYGIYGLKLTNSLISGNSISGNTYGVTLLRSEGNRLVGNNSSRNRYNSPGGYGFCLIESVRNILSENTVEDNVNQGIWFIQSYDNIVYRNNLLRNSPNGVDDLGKNTWYHEQLKQGNYWSDYTGRDADGNGIGDEPHAPLSLGGAQDLYPLMARSGG